MNPSLVVPAMLVPAYLIGAIPFGYLVVRALKGIDIRTVGSGNVGATNVGRVLGFRFFLLVFALDVLKGLVPTLLLPWTLGRLTGEPAPPWAAVLAALGAILGHNFPVTLGFRGGKGVATSLGCFAALDPIAGVAALLGFGGSLLTTRIVSISSIVGAVAYVATYFARAEDAWGGGLVMSLVTLALLGMMIVRHRKNYSRILAGTEPKVTLSKKSRPPAGRAGVLLVVGVALVVGSLGLSVFRESTQVEVLDAGSFTLTQVRRESTGHQRAQRPIFFDDDRRVAVLCPRYGRVALLDVGDDAKSLTPSGEIRLEGRPMAIAATADRLYVLQRPDSDRRHLESGWVQPFDFAGRPVDGRFEAGINPDDLAITPDGQTALVVSGERTVKGGGSPLRHLSAFDLDAHTPALIGRVELGHWEDEPGRVHLSASGRAATVAIHATGHAQAIDLTDPHAPRALGEPTKMPVRDLGYLSASDDDRLLMPVASAGESLVLDGLFGDDDATLVLGTRPAESAVEVVAFTGKSERSLGLLRLKGPLNLGEAKPSGLAWSPRRRLVAVASKSGAVHLLAVDVPAAAVAQADAAGPGVRR